MGVKARRAAYAVLESDQPALVVGTHALIQEKVQYRNLALVITDEQHRFGVKQRETFSLKGSHPHILVMSATPIPRTLASFCTGIWIFLSLMKYRRSVCLSKTAW